MFYVRRNVDDRTGQNLLRGLALLLIPTTTGNAYEHLSAAFRGFMDMPVVAATRLESNVRERNLRVGDTGEIAFALKVFGVCGVRLTNRKYHFLLKAFFFSCRICRVSPDLLRYAESRPRIGPAGIKGSLCQQCGNLPAGDAVPFAHFEVRTERRVNKPLAEQNRNGNHTAVVQRKRRIVPDSLAEKNIVVQLREFRSEIAEHGAPGGLFDFFLCHKCRMIECRKHHGEYKNYLFHKSIRFESQ